MGKIKIQYVNNKGDCIRMPIEIQCEFVPRVGELLKRDELQSETGSDLFMITSVIYRHSDSGLVPWITATDVPSRARAEMLGSKGWIPFNKLDSTFPIDEKDVGNFENRDEEKEDYLLRKV
ncbi:MAG: hypothetical protein WD708_00930 [Kiritimatiellia bacterium]